MTNDSVLAVWVIYHKPRDLPQYEYVVRRQWAGKGGEIKLDREYFGARDLDEARGFVPPFLHRLPRAEEDDPVIVETWI